MGGKEKSVHHLSEQICLFPFGYIFVCFDREEVHFSLFWRFTLGMNCLNSIEICLLRLHIGMDPGSQRAEDPSATQVISNVLLTRTPDHKNTGTYCLGHFLPKRGSVGSESSAYATPLAGNFG